MTPNYEFHWAVVLDRWPMFLAGAWTDLWVTLLGFSFACVIGLAVALMRAEGNSLISGPAVAFVEVARGVPTYVFLLWVHFGIAGFLGLALTPIQSVLTVLAITGGGYTAEIFRAGLSAIDRGQVEAARSLGLGEIRIYADVILPQALRIVVPPLGNILIGLLKGATLMSVIAVPDMMHIAQDLNMNYFVPFEAFTAVLLIFVSIVAVISLFVIAIERTLAHP